MVKSISKLFRPKLFVAGLVLAIVGAFSATIASPKSVAAICNDVICGGVSNAQQMVDAYNNNDDVRAIYDSDMFGKLGSDGAARFGGQAKEAKSYKDGRTILSDGRVVLTDGKSLGRTGGPGTFNPYTINIGGTNYFWGFNYQSFGSDGLRTLVLMDKDDKYAQFAALTSCGNPMGGERPHFQCDMLSAKQTGDNDFDFKTEVSLKNSTVKNLHYNFGDGSTKDTTDLTVSHHYDKAGKFHVTVTVTYIVNGVETSETLQAHCQTDVEVKEKKVPEFACTLLEPTNLGDFKYKFNGKASFKDTEITATSFDFGDGQTGPGVVSNKTATGADITAEHKYAEFTGTKTITLSVDFKTGSDRHNAKCQTKIVREILNKCVPTKGQDNECNEIPATGPTEIFGAAAGAGGLGAAGMYFRNSRRNLRNIVDKFKR